MDPKVKMLVKDLKNKSPGIRQNAAKELGKLQVEDAIKPLIKMAAGGFRKFLAKYDLNDQLAAIEALAETGSIRALNFIKDINKYSGREVQGYDSREEGYTKGTRYYFPYVRGNLRKAITPQVLMSPEFTETGKEDEFNECTITIQNALKRINETVAEKKEKVVSCKEPENKKTYAQTSMKKQDAGEFMQLACGIGSAVWGVCSTSLVLFVPLCSTIAGSSAGAIAYYSLFSFLSTSGTPGALLAGSAITIGAAAGLWWGIANGVKIADLFSELNPFEKE